MYIFFKIITLFNFLFSALWLGRGEPHHCFSWLLYRTCLRQATRVVRPSDLGPHELLDLPGVRFRVLQDLWGGPCCLHRVCQRACNEPKMNNSCPYCRASLTSIRIEELAKKYAFPCRYTSSSCPLSLPRTERSIRTSATGAAIRYVFNKSAGLKFIP